MEISIVFGQSPKLGTAKGVRFSGVTINRNPFWPSWFEPTRPDSTQPDPTQNFIKAARSDPTSLHGVLSTLMTFVKKKHRNTWNIDFQSKSGDPWRIVSYSELVFSDLNEMKSISSTQCFLPESTWPEGIFTWLGTANRKFRVVSNGNRTLWIGENSIEIWRKVLF